MTANENYANQQEADAAFEKSGINEILRDHGFIYDPDPAFDAVRRYYQYIPGLTTVIEIPYSKTNWIKVQINRISYHLNYQHETNYTILFDGRMNLHAPDFLRDLLNSLYL